MNDSFEGECPTCGQEYLSIRDGQVNKLTYEQKATLLSAEDMSVYLAAQDALALIDAQAATLERVRAIVRAHGADSFFLQKVEAALGPAPAQAVSSSCYAEQMGIDPTPDFIPAPAQAEPFKFGDYASVKRLWLEVTDKLEAAEARCAELLKRAESAERSLSTERRCTDINVAEKHRAEARCAELEAEVAGLRDQLKLVDGHSAEFYRARVLKLEAKLRGIGC